ncbi:MAG: TaqI-like C-terminal specificity domain-containing protein [Bacteroidota bacterium]
MELRILKPRKALNKAFLKVKPRRTEIESFKTNLIQLLDRINDTESEEFHKNLVIDFLKKTYYEPDHYINTKGRNDLVIHNSDKASGTVGVIIEAKKPGNKPEMLTTEKINVKAFQELVLYYLRERITHKNIEIKYLIATNINEWFIFDATLFDRLFAQNKTLLKLFNDFDSGRLADTKTDFFYKQVAEPFIADIKHEIEFTHFDIREYEKPLRNNDQKDDNKLISLFKLLSPEHLLKLPFANDSNSLDKRFYSELLHIIGLTETQDGSKKLIERNKEGKRNSGSLLENAIIQLDSLDKISRLPNPGHFGANMQERLFNVGLELCITWINRILFLKLLEAQLISYHKGDKAFEFLSPDKIKDYDDLNSLFFQVLARKQDERNPDAGKLFAKVPYLNSSLFEPTEIEHTTLFISNLSDDHTIPVYTASVLKDDKGKKRTGNINPLAYLFEFLNTYDFASEGSEEIQEDNKTLINASVLGLIFEKINGYKDGSFFTPGFITMYMCRETIRKAVVQKFNETKGWDCTDINSLYDKIEDRKEANQIINSLKICDPAVGSGHFLVSALNEIIAIKSDLKVLLDREGRRLKEYQAEVVNDELIVTDEDGELFEYNPAHSSTGSLQGKESQRVQETLFHEKQSIIENCLFGVDINPNSVKICRLRLWIELLKNAYYKNGTELETLPNIDINIKCGNSLISRFALDADLKQALKKSTGKWTIDSYRLAVDTYRNAQSKEQKRDMERLMNEIKTNFRSEISSNDPKVKRLRMLNGELFTLTNQGQLFEFSVKEKAGWNLKVEKLTAEIIKLEAEIEEIKGNKIYENAFEWRFEFPEVLNDNGDFVGFDVVIGNPPYIRQEEFLDIKPYLSDHFKVFSGTSDLYTYFVEQGISLLKPKGKFIFILPNKWMRAGYGLKLRQFIKGNAIDSILNFGDLPVFEEATTYPCILQLSKDQPVASFEAMNMQTLYYPMGIEVYLKANKIKVLSSELQGEGWALLDSRSQQLLAKLKSSGIPLGEYVNGKIFYGIKTGLNEAFVIDKDTRDRLIAEDPKSDEIIKPFLAGRDIKRYQHPVADKFLILFKNGATHRLFGELGEEDALNSISEMYPALMRYLSGFILKAKARYDKGHYWWELRACDYYEEFEKQKIMLPDISLRCEALLDSDNGYYCVNTAYIIPGLSLSDLAIINSNLVQFFYSNLTQSIRGGYLRFIRQYLEQIPIIKTEILDEKVSRIIELKRANPNADTFGNEYEINQLVYQLYDLTPEEIEIIENGVK